jgi:hypothetical protein
MAVRTPRERPRAYLKSGVYTLKKAVAMLGNRTMPPKSTALGRELRAWRAALVSDLGGVETVSTQQEALIDLAVRSKLMVDSIDAYVLGMPSPVDKRHRRLWPVVRERQSLVAQLQSLLRDLGLERKAKEVPSLAAYIAARAATPSRPAEVAPSSSSPGPGEPT